MKMMNSSYAPLVAGGEIPRACFREAVGPGKGGLVAEASASALIGIATLVGIAALVGASARAGRLEGGREGEVGGELHRARVLRAAVAPLVEEIGRAHV